MNGDARCDSRPARWGFKSSRPLLSTLLVRAARALFRPSSLELGGVGLYDSEDRRIFFDLSQISTILEHGFYLRQRKLDEYIIIDKQVGDDY
jgi:hypothetical protein